MNFCLKWLVYHSGRERESKINETMSYEANINFYSLFWLVLVWFPKSFSVNISSLLSSASFLNSSTIEIERYIFRVVAELLYIPNSNTCLTYYNTWKFYKLYKRSLLRYTYLLFFLLQISFFPFLNYKLTNQVALGSSMCCIYISSKKFFK